MSNVIGWLTSIILTSCSNETSQTRVKTLRGAEPLATNYITWPELSEIYMILMRKY